MSLQESNDIWVDRIVESSKHEIIADVKATFNDNQRAFFRDYFPYIIYDFESTAARFGFNVEVQNPEDPFVWVGNSLESRVRIYNFIPQYLIDEVPLTRFVDRGVPAGKYYVDDPENHVSRKDLIELLRTRQVIVGEGGGLDSDERLITGPNDRLFLPLNREIYLPNSKYGEMILRKVFHKRIPRTRLTAYQSPVPVDRLQFDNGGFVSTVTLWTNGLEVIIVDDKNRGVVHSEARVGSQYTKGTLFVELLKTEKAKEIEGIEVRLSRPRNKKPRIYVSSSPKDNVTDGEISRHHRELIRKKIKLFDYPGDYLHSIEFCLLDPNLNRLDRFRVARDDVLSQSRLLYTDLAGVNDISLLFNQFPGRISRESQGDVMDRLESLAKEKRLKNVYLLNASNGEFFTASSLHQLDRIWENGANVYWRNPTSMKWVAYNSGFWVNPKKLQKFVDLTKSGKIAAFYGTSESIDNEMVQHIRNSVEGYKKFHGGLAGVITGGGDGLSISHPNQSNFMHASSEIARQSGLMVGAGYWNLPGAGKNTNVDFAQYYEEINLLERQKLMAKIVDVEIYGTGGVGTALELANTLTNKKIGIGERKPVILIGNGLDLIYQFVEQKVKEKRIPKPVMDSIYRSNDGSDVYDILTRHFRTMR